MCTSSLTYLLITTKKKKHWVDVDVKVATSNNVIPWTVCVYLDKMHLVLLTDLSVGLLRQILTFLTVHHFLCKGHMQLYYSLRKNNLQHQHKEESLTSRSRLVISLHKTQRITNTYIKHFPSWLTCDFILFSVHGLTAHANNLDVLTKKLNECVFNLIASASFRLIPLVLIMHFILRFLSCLS